jgi:aminopeptidase N
LTGSAWWRSRRLTRPGLALALVASLAACSSSSGERATTAPPAPAATQAPTTLAPTTVAPVTSPPTTVAPASGTPTTTATEAAAGVEGIGDPYYPSLGNGGYQVVRYELDLAWDPSGETLEGTAAIVATADRELTTFHLDLTGMEVTGVEVDGASAQFDRFGSELAISPLEPVAPGPFRVVVDYRGDPAGTTPEGSLFGPSSWHPDEDGAFVMGEPFGASGWFPCNDHPADKAQVRLRMQVPEPFAVASSGVLEGTERADGGDRVFTWRTTRPLAPYMLALGIGRWVVDEQQGPVPIVNYMDPDLTEAETAMFDRQPEMLEKLVELFGPYPFASYGALVVDDESPQAALETQTLSTFSRASLGFGSNVVVHEMAHQWFGNSVTLTTWQDIWLHEGFATYSEWLWEEADAGPEALDASVRFAYGVIGGEAAVAQGADPAEVAEALPNIFPPPGDPGPDQVFNPSVYLRGGLTLHALRLEMGDEDFFRLLKSWARRHRYGNVTTADFVSLAGGIAATPVDRLMEAWLYQPVVPPMPQLGLSPVGG